MSKPQSALRLDRLLSNLGYASRKETASACSNGKVTLNGERVTRANTIIPLKLVRDGALKFQNETVGPLSPLTIMLHKPAGYTCSHSDLGPLVYDLLPPRWRLRKPSLSTVGRLDKESTGQLLLTDDGQLLHRIIHPRTHSSKHYHVTTRDPLNGNESTLFASGEFFLANDDKPLKPANWKPGNNNSGVMILTEGRYHQIRRMFAALGNHVTQLHRFQTGDLILGELTAGQFQILDANDLNTL